MRVRCHQISADDDAADAGGWPRSRARDGDEAACSAADADAPAASASGRPGVRADNDGAAWRAAPAEVPGAPWGGWPHESAHDDNAATSRVGGLGSRCESSDAGDLAPLRVDEVVAQPLWRAPSPRGRVPAPTHPVPRISVVLDDLREVDSLTDVVHAVLAIVVAGDLAPVVELNQILQGALDACLHDKPEFETLSTAHGDVLNMTMQTMTRLRGGRPFVLRGPAFLPRVAAEDTLGGCPLDHKDHMRNPHRSSPSPLAGRPLGQAPEHEDAPETASAPIALTTTTDHDVLLPPLAAPGDICPAVLERLGRMEADFATAIRLAIATLEEKSLTRSEASLSLCGPPSRGPCAPLGGAPTVALAAVPRPGLGASGFLCNMRTKGFFGLRGVVVSSDSQRAGVRIDETGHVVFVLLSHLVFGHRFLPEPLPHPAGYSPIGPPDLLQDLTFVAFHANGTSATASSGSADHSYSSDMRIRAATPEPSGPPRPTALPNVQ